jgi:YD repeat-containing protein
LVGRLLRTPPSPGSAEHYAHDGAGRTVGISDPFGDTTRFVYDAAGRRVQKLGTQGLRSETSKGSSRRR